MLLVLEKSEVLVKFLVAVYFQNKSLNSFCIVTSLFSCIDGSTYIKVAHE